MLYLCRPISLRRQVPTFPSSLSTRKQGRCRPSSMPRTSEPRSRRARTKDRAVSWGRAKDRRDLYQERSCRELFCHCLYEEIKEKNYSLSAGQYFDIKIDYVDITAEEFEAKMTAFQDKLSDLFQQSHALEQEIKEQNEGVEVWVSGKNIPLVRFCSRFSSGKSIKASQISAEGLYPVYGGKWIKGASLILSTLTESAQ